MSTTASPIEVTYRPKTKAYRQVFAVGLHPFIKDICESIVVASVDSENAIHAFKQALATYHTRHFVVIDPEHKSKLPESRQLSLSKYFSGESKDVEVLFIEPNWSSGQIEEKSTLAESLKRLGRYPAVILLMTKDDEATATKLCSALAGLYRPLSANGSNTPRVAQKSRLYTFIYKKQTEQELLQQQFDKALQRRRLKQEQTNTASAAADESD